VDFVPSPDGFSLNVIRNNNTQSFEALWPQIAKGLKRAGIDPEAIKRARGFAEAYASPNKKHMIGVECHQIDEALRHQLGLEHGLVVKDVFQGTPAKEAGIEKFDILVEADDIQLAKVRDLVDAVQAAGVEDSKVNLVVLRKGEKQTISMKPKKREDADQPAIFWNSGVPLDATKQDLLDEGSLFSLEEELLSIEESDDSEDRQ